MWEIIAIVNIMINLVAFLYIKWLLGSYKDLSESLFDTSEELQKYLSHVKAVHELEVFYGDDTLQGLLEHGSELVHSLGQIDLIFEEEEEEEEEEEDRELENEN